VLHSDIASYDPIWTSANITAYHGAMVYDMLFGNNEKFEPRPQMVGKYGTSDDALTWTFELRDGLRFTDGAPVTSADVVPSIARWAARSASGQLLMPHVKEMTAPDEKTLRSC
jgi:peptide/nickel transport system substrate-binding protein